jgi:hypothetical protein
MARMNEDIFSGLVVWRNGRNLRREGIKTQDSRNREKRRAGMPGFKLAIGG